MRMAKQSIAPGLAGRSSVSGGPRAQEVLPPLLATAHPRQSAQVESGLAGWLGPTRPLKIEACVTQPVGFCNHTLLLGSNEIATIEGQNKGHRGKPVSAGSAFAVFAILWVPSRGSPPTV